MMNEEMLEEEKAFNEPIKAVRKKVYRGHRFSDGSVLVTWSEGADGIRKILPYRLDLQNHSPDGFNWGYDGSGPSQLALAMIADCRGDKEGLLWHTDFRRAFIAPIKGDSWEITEVQIQEWVVNRIWGQYAEGIGR